jgi:hypothetical protein
MPPQDFLFIGIFGVWTLATVLRHVSERHLPARLAALLNRSLVAFIIPGWSFFAPRPAFVDHHLRYRDRSPTGEIGPWRDCGVPSRRSVGAAFWDPSRVAVRALDQIAGVLVRSSRTLDRRPKLITATVPRAITVTVPYLALLTYVSSAGAPGGAASRQFLVFSASDYRKPDSLLSEYHRVVP